MLTKIIVSFVFLISSAFHIKHCQGETCYKGTFSKKDVMKGSHMVGVSFRNITSVPGPQTCFSACTNQCRCKAFQLQGRNCELLEEDRHSEPSKFISSPGYDYYDLHQELESKSAFPFVCRNGCCSNQRCVNGGTCVEHCETHKTKFSCRCSAFFHGKRCEKHKPASCLEVLCIYKELGETPTDGVYNISTHSGRVFPAYCAFNGGTSWTLIESFSFGNRAKFKRAPFLPSVTLSYNTMSPPSWEKYRMPRDLMEFVYTNATSYKAECDYEKMSLPSDRLLNDHAIGEVSEFDILSNGGSNDCIMFSEIRIQGRICRNCRITVWQREKHAHLVPRSHCGFTPNNVEWKNNFGKYENFDRRHTCAKNSDSTTSWWLGHEIS